MTELPLISVGNGRCFDEEIYELISRRSELHAWQAMQWLADCRAPLIRMAQPEPISRAERHINVSIINTISIC